MILLSIIIPAYNASDHIKACLESIIFNTNVDENDIEIVIINDGSTDDTENKIKFLIKEHATFNIQYKYQENKGASAARNNGISSAQGVFVWFVDADDVIANCAIEELTQVIENNDDNIDLIRIGNCNRGMLYNDDSVLDSYSCIPNNDKARIIDAYELLDPIYRNGHTMFILRRDFLLKNNLMYPEIMTFNEDYHFLVNVLLKADKAYMNLSYDFYIIRENIHSVSRSSWTYIKQEKFIEDQIIHIEFLLKLLDGSEIERNKKELLGKYFDSYLIYILFSRIRLKTQFSLTYYFLKKIDSMNAKFSHSNTFKGYILKNKISYFFIWIYYKFFK